VHSIVNSTSDSNILFLTLMACKKEEVAEKGSVSREDVSTFVGLECFLALRRARELWATSLHLHQLPVPLASSPGTLQSKSSQSEWRTSLIDVRAAGTSCVC